MANFNELFENIKGKVTQGAQTAVQKTKETASIAKANMAIRGEEDKIRKAQIELGKLYYKDYIAGEEPDAAEYTPWCEKINESKLAIEDLRQTIEDLKAPKAGTVDDDDIVEITEDDLASAGEPEDEPEAAEEAAPEETPAEEEPKAE